MRSIAELNELPASEFAEALKPLFEAAPALAAALYAAKPFFSYEELIDAAERLASHMQRDEQVAVLEAHPPIGANPETVSAASYREQGYAGEAALDPTTVATTYRQLADLNREYEQRFGFRFVVFVNKRPKSEIVEVLRARLANPPDAELRSGLRAMFLIARDRLCSLSMHLP